MNYCCSIAYLIQKLFKASLAAFILSVSPIAHAAEPPHIDLFFPEKTFGNLALSPSGDYLAFPSYQNKKQAISIIRLSDFTEVNRVDVELKQISWVKWASEDRLLAGFKAYQPGYIKREGKRRNEDDGKVAALQRVYIHRILAFDRSGDNRIILLDKARKSILRYTHLNTVVDLLPHDPDHILMAAKDKGFAVWKVNIRSGDMDKVEQGNASTIAWRTNSQGYPVFRFDRAEKSGRTTIHSRSSSSKKWKRIHSYYSGDGTLFRPIGKSRSPDTHYVLSRKDGADKSATYTYDLKTQTFLETISSHEKVDVYGKISASYGPYLGTSYETDRRENYLLDPKLQRHVTALEKFFGPEADFSFHDISRNGKVWVLFVSGMNDPGSYFLYDTRSRKTEFLMAKNYDLGPDQLGKSKFITYAARDGLEISGFLTQPPRTDQKIAPLVILPHGGPHARDYFRYDKFTQYLATRGYQVFSPNFRGSRGFGTAFEAAGYGEWGLAMQNDLTDGVSELIKRGIAQEGRICIFGLSYGGYAALMGAAQQDTPYSCAISANGVTDLHIQSAENSRKFRKEQGVLALLKKSIGDPKDDEQKLLDTSPVNLAEKMNIPVLILHGEDDPVVIVKQAQAMKDALTAAQKDVRYVELANTDHNLSIELQDYEEPDDKSESMKTLLLEVESFLNQHIGTE